MDARCRFQNTRIARRVAAIAFGLLVTTAPGAPRAAEAAPLRIAEATAAAAVPIASRPRSIRKPGGIRSRRTLFRPDTPRRRMVRARRRALAGIRRLERDIELLRSAPPPGFVTTRPGGAAEAEGKRPAGKTYETVFVPV